VANILSAAAQAGLSRDALLEAAGLRSVDFGDPDARVAGWAEVALWQLVAQRAPDPGTGILMGVASRPRQWGLLGYAVSYSSTLGAALRRLARYWRILNEAVQFRFEETTQHHVVIAQHPTELGLGLPHAVSYRFAAVMEASRTLTRAEVVATDIAFAFEQPSSTLEFRRFFRCPLSFSQPESRVTFAKRDLELPIPSGDETLAGYLSENAERVLRSLRSGTTTRERVRSTIWAELSEGPPTLRRIATALHESPRTLQRRLAAEGTTLRREVEHIREQMAIAALRERTVPIEEVAFVLGYTEPSTFYRSFRRWTGKTPRQFRTSTSDRAPRSGMPG
jgi:AraC-like DNA-binding protein